MDIGFELAKSEKNVLVRGISFELAARFEWVGALIVEIFERTTVNAGFRRWV
jgi:uncharacterized DUF497 family protein